MVTIVQLNEDAQGSGNAVTSALDDLAREGARRMILAPWDVEVAEYLARHRSARDEQGHAVVVRTGHARPRRVTLGAGNRQDPGAARH
jgi:hypothetical protein